jgi:UDP-N-acetylglucosamine--N-acetylmuramyl-(pentapeptide) pyrophosphoryl-undecaprenol N-acetylglucosamine transferase
VGCPVRAAFLSPDRPQALVRWHLRADRRTLLVAGGSLGARSVNEAVLALRRELSQLADTWQVLHVAGPQRFAEVAGAWEGGPLAVRVLEYCRRMDLALAAADVVVARGGASTVAEIAATATPAVLVPYPRHRDRQQHLNAEALVSAGAAAVVTDTLDAEQNAAALRRTLLPLLAAPDRLGAMRRAAGGLARPDAANRVADWMTACD